MNNNNDGSTRPMLVSEDKLVSSRPSIQEHLERLRNNDESKKSKKVDEKPTEKKVATRQSNRRNVDDIKTSILQKQYLHNKLSVDLKDEIAISNEINRNGMNKLNEIQTSYNNGLLDIYKSESNTKIGKEELIRLYTDLINKYTEDLANGNFTETFSAKFDQKMAELTFWLEKQNRKTKESYFDMADKKTTVAIPNIEKKISTIQDEILALEAELADVEAKANMTINDKDTGDTKRMVDEIMATSAEAETEYEMGEMNSMDGLDMEVPYMENVEDMD